MYRRYDDLRDRLGEPLWVDEQGVPRYEPYHPALGGVYDRMSALLEIACQACDARFLVASVLQEWMLAERQPALPTATDCGSVGFGDAPVHQQDQFCVGMTMTTEVQRIVEFWTRDGGPLGLEWRRRPEFEFTYPSSRGGS